MMGRMTVRPAGRASVVVVVAHHAALHHIVRASEGAKIASESVGRAAKAAERASENSAGEFVRACMCVGA